jgi:hypothetical protein
MHRIMRALAILLRSPRFDLPTACVRVRGAGFRLQV